MGRCDSPRLKLCGRALRASKIAKGTVGFVFKVAKVAKFCRRGCVGILGILQFDCPRKAGIIAATGTAGRSLAAVGSAEREAPGYPGLLVDGVCPNPYSNRPREPALALPRKLAPTESTAMMYSALMLVFQQVVDTMACSPTPAWCSVLRLQGI